MYLVFDTETTGLPLWKEPSDHPDQPHIVDIALTLFDPTGLEIDRYDAIINPGPDVIIPDDVAEIHGITTEIAREQGVAPEVAFGTFLSFVDRAETIIGHNVSFDIRMIRILAARVTGAKWDNPLAEFCTMRKSTNHCKIPSPRARHPQDYKWPKLTEAIQHLFGEDVEDAHRARPDCDNSARIFFHLKQMEHA